jgi:hypothetical protein
VKTPRSLCGHLIAGRFFLSCDSWPWTRFQKFSIGLSGPCATSQKLTVSETAATVDELPYDSNEDMVTINVFVALMKLGQTSTEITGVGNLVSGYQLNANSYCLYSICVSVSYYSVLLSVI